MRIERKFFSYLDWPLLAITLFIPCLGLTVLFSAGYDTEATQPIFSIIPLFVSSPAFIKQVLFLGVGLVILTIGVFLPVNKLTKFAYPFYGFCVMLLVAVLLVGVVIKGSRRWIDFGPIHFQPAELAKMGVILALARYLSRTPIPRGGFRLRNLMIPFIIFFIPMGLILKQPDLGTAMSVGGIGFLMILFAGVRWQTLVLLVFVATASMYPLWNHLHDYQKRRIITLVDPEADPLGSGYHIIQSKIAVGSGQVFGKGFLKGTQTQLQFLPEHTTDFIFSVLAEEWGFFGCSIVLLSYVFLLHRILRVVSKSRDLFSMYLVVGLCSFIFCHVFINIGMVIGLLPVVGIPLPLFSYGGSSLLSNMLAIGIVLGVSLRRRMYVVGR